MGKQRFRRPLALKRRLVTTPTRQGEWNTLLNYWALTDPYPGYDPVPYPGEDMPTEGLKAMLLEAQKYLGNAYKWGGKVPPNFDCSGYVAWCYKTAGLMPLDVVAHTSTLKAYCDRVPDSDRLPGDLCFWHDPNDQSPTANAHVAIYIGNDMILDSASKGVDYRAVTYHYPTWFEGYYRVPPMPEVIS